MCLECNFDPIFHFKFPIFDVPPGGSISADKLITPGSIDNSRISLVKGGLLSLLPYLRFFRTIAVKIKQHAIKRMI